MIDLRGLVVDDGPVLPSVSIEPAGPEAGPALAQLVQLYVHDLSAIGGWDVDESGHFDAELLRGCWSDIRRHPFRIRADGRLAGFTVVDKIGNTDGGEPIYDMAEFFILRRWRRSGVGRIAVRQLTRLFPGAWQVRPFPGYEPAKQFWLTICSEVAADGVTRETYERWGRSAITLRMHTRK